MKKLLVINGSPRKDDISNTFKALISEVDFYKEKYPDLEVVYKKIPKDLNGCFNCKKCNQYCNYKDGFQDILREMEDATDVLLGSPVYLDMPTPETVAFLTRLNCMAENTDRKFFEGKKIHLLATAFCSGTKTCIHTMMGACEMLGFTIDGRSTREYITKWSDEKIRGGMHREDAFFLKREENKQAYSLKYKTGMYGGSFNPLHDGHIKCIRKALTMCEKLHIIIGNIPNIDDVSIETKISWFHTVFKKERERLTLHVLEDTRLDKSEYTIEKWINDSKIIKKMIETPIDVVFCGSDYRDREPNPYQICYPDQDIVIFDRDDGINSSEFRKDPGNHREWVPDVVFESYKTRN